jgi:uncharacterized membrane protein YfcA
MQLQLGLVLVLGLALVGAVVGWRLARRQRRSFFEQPFEMSDRRYAFGRARRRLWRRLAIAVPGAIVGAVVGQLIAVYLKLP